MVSVRGLARRQLFSSTPSTWELNSHNNLCTQISATLTDPWTKKMETPPSCDSLSTPLYRRLPFMVGSRLHRRTLHLQSRALPSPPIPLESLPSAQHSSPKNLSLPLPRLHHLSHWNTHSSLTHSCTRRRDTLPSLPPSNSPTAECNRFFWYSAERSVHQQSAHTRVSRAATHFTVLSRWMCFVSLVGVLISHPVCCIRFIRQQEPLFGLLILTNWVCFDAPTNHRSLQSASDIPHFAVGAHPEGDVRPTLRRTNELQASVHRNASHNLERLEGRLQKPQTRTPSTSYIALSRKMTPTNRASDDTDTERLALRAGPPRFRSSHGRTNAVSHFRHFEQHQCIMTSCQPRTRRHCWAQVSVHGIDWEVRPRIRRRVFLHSDRKDVILPSRT